jgi:integrase
MATIEWRKGKRGRYAYLNWSQNGKQHRKSLGAVSKESAEAELYAKEYELRTGKQIISSAPLIGTVAVMYLTWHETEYPDSHERIRQIVEDHILPAFKFVAADQLAPLQVEQWKGDRMSQVAAATVGKEVRTLKAMLNWSANNRLIDYNPVRAVKPPQDRRSRPVHWYSMEELVALYKATEPVSPRRKAAWQLMANTGLRCGEARFLTPGADKGESIVLTSEPDARTKSAKWREIPLSDNESRPGRSSGR